ncbi:MAG TPA: PKD domain-containing protein, partial [Thermoplasmata archaeon]|nr:PKD domain-containing protein [Thermoplasmata archaeon]
MTRRTPGPAVATLVMLIVIAGLMLLPGSSLTVFHGAAAGSPRTAHSSTPPASSLPAAPLVVRPSNGTGGNGSGGNGTGGGSGWGSGVSILNATGPWVDLTPNLTAIPTPRQAFGMAYDPALSAVVLFGGQNSGGSELGDTWEFSNGSWTDLTSTLSTAPSARYGLGMVYEPQNQSVLLFGGRTSGGTWYNDTWMFNATGWHQLNLSTAPPPWAPGAPSLAYDGHDGYALIHGNPHGTSYQETWKFENGSWSNITSLQTGTLPALGFIPIYDAADGYMVYYGGDRAGCSGAGLTWKYAANTWTNITSTAGSPTAAMGSGAIVYDENLSAVVMFGGYTASCAVINETWTFLGGKWMALPTPPPTPPGVWDARLVWDAAANADILVGGNGAAIGGSNSFVNDTWEFVASRVAPATVSVQPLTGRSPLNVTFTTSPVSHVAHLPLSVNWSFGDGSPNATTLVAAHVYGSTGTYHAGLTVRDASGRALRALITIFVTTGPKGVWLNVISSSSTATTPTGRQAFVMEYDPLLGQVILFGGQDTNGNAIGDTWAYSGGAWTSLTPASSPSARWGAAMVYDPSEKGLVLFGGRDQYFNYFNDTWLYSSAGWTNITPTGASPSPRNVNSKLVYDAGDGYDLLAGGANINVGSFTDTWKFESGKWTNITSKVTGSPPAYIGRGVYDPAAGVVVFYGGAGSCTGPSVTWTYRAGNWTDITTTAGSPTAAAGAGAITYDPIEKGVIFTGGYDNYCDVVNQTWVFRNSAWTDITNTTGGPNPPGRWEARMAFDPLLGGDLVFGGNEQYTGGSNYFLTDTWEYHDGLNVSASSNRTVGLVPLSVAFRSPTVSGGSSPYFYNWTFGDGTLNSTAAGPTHTYSTTGAFLATVLVNDSAGRFGVADITINVYPTLAVSPTVTPSTGEAPLPVSFTANGTGGVPPVSYRWGFGDGNSSAARIASHTYTRSGTFTWNVTMTDSRGNTMNSSGTITVVPTLVVSVKSQGGPGEYPLTVQFNSTLTGGEGPFTYNWSFGDGSFGTDAATTSHVYDRAGAFVAVCNVTDALRTTHGARSVIVVVNPLIAGSSESASSGEAPLTVQFAAAPSGGEAPYTILWTFGDGGESTLASVSHTYSTVGNYTANVTVTDAYNDTLTRAYHIQVAAPLAVVLAALPGRGIAPFAVTFTPTAAGGVLPLSYLWSFGDGSTSTTAGPVTHTFTEAGTFTTSLTVSDAGGAHVRTTAVVQAGGRMAGTVSANASSVFTGTAVGFTAHISGGFPAYSYLWTGLPAGCSSSNATALSCTPSQAGTFSVVVTATDQLGNEVNATTSLVVLAPSVPTPTGT